MLFISSQGHNTFSVKSMYLKFTDFVSIKWNRNDYISYDQKRL